MNWDTCEKTGCSRKLHTNAAYKRGTCAACHLGDAPSEQKVELQKKHRVWAGGSFEDARVHATTEKEKDMGKSTSKYTPELGVEYARAVHKEHGSLKYGAEALGLNVSGAKKAVYAGRQGGARSEFAEAFDTELARLRESEPSNGTRRRIVAAKVPGQEQCEAEKAPVKALLQNVLDLADSVRPAVERILRREVTAEEQRELIWWAAESFDGGGS